MSGLKRHHQSCLSVTVPSNSPILGWTPVRSCCPLTAPSGSSIIQHPLSLINNVRRSTNRDSPRKGLSQVPIVMERINYLDKLTSFAKSCLNLDKFWNLSDFFFYPFKPRCYMYIHKSNSDLQEVSVKILKNYIYVALANKVWLVNICIAQSYSMNSSNQRRVRKGNSSPSIRATDTLPSRPLPSSSLSASQGHSSWCNIKLNNQPGNPCLQLLSRPFLFYYLTPSLFPFGLFPCRR